MGVVIDPMEDELIRELYGKGRTEGRAEGEKTVLRKQLATRFGPLPRWAEEKLASASEEQLNEWAVWLLSAEHLEGVFRS